MLSILMIFAFWELLHLLLGIPALPSPAETVFALFSGEWLVAGLAGFAVSLYRVAAGMGLAVVIGSAVGIFLGRNKKAARIFMPVVRGFFPVPKVAFLPVLAVMMGLGDFPKIFLIFIIVFFQVVTGVYDRSVSVPESMELSVDALNPTGLQKIVHLVIPYCMPAVLTSVRISIGISISVLFFAESFAGNSGLGYLVFNALEKRDYPEMYAGIVLLSLLGALLYKLTDLVEQKRN